MPSGVYKRTKQHLLNISKAHSGEGNPFYGKKHTPETVKKIRAAVSGKNNHLFGKKRVFTWGWKIGLGHKGLKHTVEQRRKIGLAQSGAKSRWWKGGITPVNQKIRHSFDYKLWRDAVFRRDKYTCVLCGARNGKGRTVVLNADHIKGFADYPELRFEVSNGRTLCVPCHRKTDNYGGRYFKKAVLITPIK